MAYHLDDGYPVPVHTDIDTDEQLVEWLLNRVKEEDHYAWFEVGLTNDYLEAQHVIDAVWLGTARLMQHVILRGPVDANEFAYDPNDLFSLADLVELVSADKEQQGELAFLLETLEYFGVEDMQEKKPDIEPVLPEERQLFLTALHEKPIEMRGTEMVQRLQDFVTSHERAMRNPFDYDLLQQ